MGSAIQGWVRVPSRSQQVTPAPLALQGSGVAAEPAWPRSWKRVLCSVGTAVSGLERVLVARRHEGAESPRGPIPVAEQLPRLVQKVVSEWPLPQFVALFLPEFPVRPPIRQQQLKVRGPLGWGRSRGPRDRARPQPWPSQPPHLLPGTLLCQPPGDTSLSLLNPFPGSGCGGSGPGVSFLLQGSGLRAPGPGPGSAMKT